MNQTGSISPTFSAPNKHLECFSFNLKPSNMDLGGKNVVLEKESGAHPNGISDEISQLLTKIKKERKKEPPTDIL